jgi:hypothetical protein
MSKTKPLADNIVARLDAMRDIREAKDRLKLLEEQWEDISAELHREDVMAWIDFAYGNDPSVKVTWVKVNAEWEAKNPVWQIVNNGLRRRKEPSK